ncbi:MAG: hypothetical protein AAGJ82_08090 [Bacteroidota bacterium]
MQRAFYCCFPLLFLLMANAGQAAVRAPSSAVLPPLTLAEFSELSPDELTEYVGRKLTLKERLGLRLLRRKIRKDPSFGQQNWRTNEASLPAETDCDHLFLLDGTKLPVRLEYVGRETVTYYRCEDREGEMFTLPTSETLLIRDFRNVNLYLTRDREQRRFLRKVVLQNEPHERSDRLAILALVTSVGSFILLVAFWPLGVLGALGAMFLSGRSKMRYKHLAESYDGKDMASLAQIISIVGLLIGLMLYAFTYQM